ncbi:exonuclease domain protein [Ceratobasidium sp. AG-Ba]|nr:exonuclease domain protein [Ceratobasidium sp. AG-Ba]
MNPLQYEDGPLVWLDLETSGLDPAKARILEVAVLITNGDLEIVDEKGCELVVNLKAETMKEMDRWTRNQHAKSGLLAKAEESTLTAPEVADEVLAYIKHWIPKPGIAQLAGSSIHFDAMFLRSAGPDVAEHGGKLIWKKIMDHLHHRRVEMWYPKVYREYGDKFQKESKHRALDDLRESIIELKFYRETMFAKPEEEIEKEAETKKRKLE